MCNPALISLTANFYKSNPFMYFAEVESAAGDVTLDDNRTDLTGLWLHLDASDSTWQHFDWTGHRDFNFF